MWGALSPDRARELLDIAEAEVDDSAPVAPRRGCHGLYRYRRVRTLMPSAIVNAAISTRPSVPVNTASAGLNTSRTIAPSASVTTTAAAISQASTAIRSANNTLRGRVSAETTQRNRRRRTPGGGGMHGDRDRARRGQNST